MDSVAKAKRFQALHREGDILVVANAWDAASARVFEDAGMKAVGTGSAGVAFSHGYPDGEIMSRAVMLAAIGEIVAAVDVPVTADIVTGYGDTIEAVVDMVQAVIALGAVGVNIEDSAASGVARLADAALQTEKIRAVSDAVRASGVPIVINARTDSYWLKLGGEKERLSESIARANRYREAGADCLFVPSVTDQATIKTLVAEIAGPINILAVPGCPPIGELQRLGVRRLSQGSGPMRATMMLTRKIAQELLSSGTYTRFHGDAVPYADANRLFE